MKRRAGLSWLVLAATAVVAAAATVDALRGGTEVRSLEEPSGETTLTGERVPEPGRLAGTLVFASQAGCRPQALPLATLAPGPSGPSLDCGLWVPPQGQLAAVALAPALGFRGSRAALLRLGDPPEVARPLGTVRGEPSWSDDGRRLAWCTEASDTIVLDVASGGRTRLAGCHPKVAPDGSVLTRPASFLTATLLRDGEPLLGPEQLLQAFAADEEGPLDVVGYDVRADGLLAVVAVRFEGGRPRRMLQLWRGERLERAVLLPELGLPAGSGRLGDRVEFAPSGRELAIAFPGPGKQMLVADAESGRIVLEPTFQHGFAWSPDGRWLAVSTGEEIRVLDADRGDPAYVLPVGAATLAWR